MNNSDERDYKEEAYNAATALEEEEELLERLSEVRREKQSERINHRKPNGHLYSLGTYENMIVVFALQEYIARKATDEDDLSWLRELAWKMNDSAVNVDIIVKERHPE
jgi:hypothetical protein